MSQPILEAGAPIELLLGNVKGNPVWAVGTVVAYNKASATYNVLCDGFGEVRRQFRPDLPMKRTTFVLTLWACCAGPRLPRGCRETIRDYSREDRRGAHCGSGCQKSLGGE